MCKRPQTPRKTQTTLLHDDKTGETAENCDRWLATHTFTDIHTERGRDTDGLVAATLARIFRWTWLSFVLLTKTLCHYYNCSCSSISLRFWHETLSISSSNSIRRVCVSKIRKFLSLSPYSLSLSLFLEKVVGKASWQAFAPRSPCLPLSPVDVSIYFQGKRNSRSSDAATTSNRRRVATGTAAAAAALPCASFSSEYTEFTVDEF